jgi:hypothetical protein
MTQNATRTASVKAPEPRALCGLWLEVGHTRSALGLTPDHPAPMTPHRAARLARVDSLRIVLREAAASALARKHAPATAYEAVTQRLPDDMTDLSNAAQA